MALTDKDINNIIGNVTSKTKVTPSRAMFEASALKAGEARFEQIFRLGNGDVEQMKLIHAHMLNPKRETIFSHPAYRPKLDYYREIFSLYDEKVVLGWTPPKGL